MPSKPTDAVRSSAVEDYLDLINTSPQTLHAIEALVEELKAQPKLLSRIRPHANGN